MKNTNYTPDQLATIEELKPFRSGILAKIEALGGNKKVTMEKMIDAGHVWEELFYDFGRDKKQASLRLVDYCIQHGSDSYGQSLYKCQKASGYYA